MPKREKVLAEKLAGAKQHRECVSQTAVLYKAAGRFILENVILISSKFK